MQKAPLATLAAILLLSVATAAPLTFSDPGNFEAASLDVHRGQWIVAVFRPAEGGNGSLEVPTTVHHVNYTTIHTARLRDPGQSIVDVNVHNDTTQSSFGPGHLRFPGRDLGLAGLYVEAATLEVHAASVGGALRTKEAEQSTATFARAQDRDSVVRPHAPAGDHAVATLEPTAATARFRLHADGATYVEWYNLAAACSPAVDGCPSNGGPFIQEAESPTGHRVSTERHSYEILSGALGPLDLEGDLLYLAVGSRSLDVAIRGSVRLPLATVTGCSGCLAPDNQTLAATGNVTLSNLRTSADGSLAGELSGEIGSARFDETAVDPAALAGLGLKVGLGAAAAAAGGALAFKLLLQPLVTRMSPQDALRHPRRRTIYDYVVAHPGSNVSDVSAATAIGSSSLRHHLNVLQRAGHIVQKPHKSTLRVFQNHGMYDHNWNEVVLLREPPLARLHDWLLKNPHATQRKVVDALGAEGWTRSTVQHRLGRLVSGGLVEVRHAGRRKIYSAAPRAGLQA
jgi:DNA-binding transcriptional ArsR family regulator